MRGVEERIEVRLFALGNGINSHTTRTMASLGTEINTHSTSIAATSIDIHITYHNHLIEQLRMLTDASEEYNCRMTGIKSALLYNPKELPILPMSPPTNPDNTNP
jgi:hypothetical protein